MKESVFMNMGWGVAVALLLCFALYYHYSPGVVKTVAYVDIDRVLNESAIKQQSDNRIISLKQKLFSLAHEAEKQYRLLPEDKRNEASLYDASLIKLIWTKELGYIKRKNIEAINQQIKETLSKRYSMVLTGAVVTFANQQVDVTDEVTVALENKIIDYGDLPDFTVKTLSEKDINSSNSPVGKKTAR
ncbi:hypothetical protein AAEU41_23785 [Pantoea agglomerans]